MNENHYIDENRPRLDQQNNSHDELEQQHYFNDGINIRLFNTV